MIKSRSTTLLQRKLI